MNLEQELKDALKRQSPPGMTERVMAAIESKQTPRVRAPFWSVRGSGLQMAAAALLIAVVGVGVVRQQEAKRERQQGERAAQQLITALRIASETLNTVKSEIKN